MRMDRSEPVLLYASESSPCALLSWRPESSTETHFFAIPGQDGRTKISASFAKPPGEIRGSLEKRLQQCGGIWVRMEPSEGEYQMVMKIWPAEGYQPPDKMMVLGAASTIEERSLGAGGTRLKPTECALLPVDAASQSQLEQWLAGLKGLPGDLRAATLQSLAQGGVLDSLRSRAEHAAAQPPKMGLTWLWIVLAALLGIAAGFAAGSVVTRSRAPQPVRESTAVPAPPALPLAGPLGDLEVKMAGSKDAKINNLYDTHLTPFSLEPSNSTAKRTAEAWMVLKLLLYQGNPNLGNPNIDMSWSAASNQHALDEFKKQPEKLDPDKVVAAIACSLGLPPAGTVGEAECSNIDQTRALAGLAKLGEFAAAAMPRNKDAKP